MAEGDGGVSLVAPDGGSVTPVPDQPNADGERASPGVGDVHERRLEAEDELDASLGAIYDRMNPEGDENVKPPEKRVQPRAPDGKFSGKESDAKAGAPEKEVTGDQTQTKEGEGQAPPATFALPRSWSPSMKETWDGIPPEAQRLISDREMQAHSAISEQGQALAAYKPLGSVLLQNKDLFQKHRAHPVDAVNRLLDVQRKLDQDAPRTLAAIAKRYGVTAGQIANALGQALPTATAGTEAPTGARDPRVDQVAEQLAKIDQRLSQREIQDREARIQYDAEQQSAVDTDVATWAQDKPFYHHVRERMAVLIENDLVDDLDEAYRKACDFDPEIAKQLEAQKARDEQARLAKDEQDRKAQEKSARDRHVSEAKRVGRMQLDDTQRPAHKGKRNGAWNTDSYLEDLYDRVSK
jgi:hypothetical protein